MLEKRHLERDSAGGLSREAIGLRRGGLKGRKYRVSKPTSPVPRPTLRGRGRESESTAPTPS